VFGKNQYDRHNWLIGWFMVVNATFNNISVIYKKLALAGRK
jgi:hypothetical protein